jgi:hypothetical protein
MERSDLGKPEVFLLKPKKLDLIIKPGQAEYPLTEVWSLQLAGQVILFLFDIPL